VLARFGPRLPQIAEAALIRASTRPPAPVRRRFPGWVYGLGGVLVGAALVALGTLL
jgi:ubiquinone biosynthesis protein